MEKTMLQQRIEEKAEQMLEKEFNDFIKLLGGNVFGRELKISIGDGKKMKFINSHGYTGGTFFNGSLKGVTDYGNNLTNIQQLIDNRRAELVEEVTDELLDKINLLTEFINH